jgi:hypothetical protein
MKNDIQGALAPVKVLNLEKPAFSMLVTPVVSNQEILTAWQAYQELKLKLLTKDDFAKIQGQEFPKKSAYRKLALAFGVSVEILNEKRIEITNGVAYEISAKAVSPNGRFMVAVGSAHSNEKRFSKPSDIRAIAQTRATNRAISDLLGGVLGVSADEIFADSEPEIYEPFAPIALDEPEEDVEEGAEMDKTYFDKMFENQETPIGDSSMATQKQIDLIIKLAESKCYSELDRSYYLRSIESGLLSKITASQYISQLLKMAR